VALGQNMSKISNSKEEIILNDLFPFIRDGNKSFLCRYGFLRFPGTVEKMLFHKRFHVF
jgi:hypothetical protein